jgi:hypothetical protein
MLGYFFIIEYHLILYDLFGCRGTVDTFSKFEYHLVLLYGLEYQFTSYDLNNGFPIWSDRVVEV